MAKALISVVVSIAIAALSAAAYAQEKKCPKGKVYNPDTKKCVTPRGSY
jgi:hypothetical protein